MARSSGATKDTITALRKVDEATRKSVRQQHARWIGVLGSRARKNLQASILRPGERNNRPGRRATGSFTFGSGATFEGYIEEQKGVIGFGYPKVARADARTDYVWRSLEWGLRPAPQVAGTTKMTVAAARNLAPRGSAKFPLRFTFEPFGLGNPDSRLIPLSSRSGPSGRLIVPRGARGPRRWPAPSRHPGIKGKLFISKAWDEYVAPKIDEDYKLVITESIDKLLK